MLFQHEKCRQAMPACSHPITDQETRHAIPACTMQKSYPSMQSPNHRPGKVDTLSQHAVETNHKSWKSDTLSQHAQCRQAILACIAKYALYKRGCKAPKQWTSWHSNIVVENRRDLHKKSKQSKQLQHLRRLDMAEVWGIRLHLWS